MTRTAGRVAHSGDAGPPRTRSVGGRWRANLVRDPRAWIAVLAFGLRLAWALTVPSRPVGDFALYREAAAYLLDQGRLDPEFIYMPGYVFLLAALQAVGGGLLAAKMIGVIAGTLVVIAVGGIADALFGRRAAIVAGALAALWPAGIAVVSVTGTDVPSGALVALAILALARLGPRHPWRAAVISGLLFGLGAWVRAVAAPLAAVSLLFWLATGSRPWVALGRTAVAILTAFVLLLPWALRNQRVYGELFFTDSHGGNTALVGANPNSEGTYSRSLNLMFARGTGYRALESTARHRESNRAAYALAKQWTAFEPMYALGLVVAKADRLLTHERNLLYWPVYRQGVLSSDRRAFFDAHRGFFESLTDGFWWMLCALGAAGVAICGAQRDWRALSLLLFSLTLAGIYVLFFSEVRYHLAVAPLYFPYAAFAIDWAWLSARRRFRGDGRRLAIAAIAIAALFAGWRGLLVMGKTLRADHRWAIAVCAYPDAVHSHLCAWRPVLPRNGESPVRGVWDGVGLRLAREPSDGVLASARTLIPVGAGRFRVSATVSLGGGRSQEDTVTVALRADDRVIARAVSPKKTERKSDTPDQPSPISASSDTDDTGDTVFGRAARRPNREDLDAINVLILGVVDHFDGPLVLEIEAEPSGMGSIPDAGMIWISHLIVERF
jgi:4-amino-4-deoxy-L-arabinose transferase-like glycosyltransferase